MHRKRNECDHAGENGVPIPNAGIRAGFEVGPQWGEEVTIFREWNSANNISQRSAKKYRQQNASNRKQPVKEIAPHRIIEMNTKLNPNGPQHQQPEHNI